MSALGPGDFVECVDASDAIHIILRDRHSVPLVVGAVYRVREIDTTPTLDGEDGVVLWGIEMAAGGGWSRSFRISRFRPLYRPKADLIESLKTPVERERVPA